MPIGIEFQPPMAQIAGAANAAGMGQYLDRQQAIALQQQAQAIQNQRFREQMAAQLYSQEQNRIAQQQSQVFNAARQQAMLDRTQGFQEDRDVWQRQNQVEDAQRVRGERLEDLTAQRNWEVERMPAVFGFQSATRGVDEVETSLQGELTGLQKQHKYMSEAGRSQLAELSGQYRAIQKTRDWARPQDYARVLGEFGEKLARADLASSVETPKTIEQAIASGEAYEQDISAEDGSPMGRVLWTRSMRNGSPTLVPKVIPYKEKPDPLKDFMRDNLKHFVNTETGEANVDAAIAAYTKLQALSSGQPMPPAMPATTPVAAPPSTAAPAVTPASAQSIPETHKPLALALPKPQSMDEVLTLPPGTVFMWVDGTMRKVPQK